MDAERHRPAWRRFRRWCGLTLLLIGLIGGMDALASPWVTLGINGTPSLPGVLYLVIKGQAPRGRGDLVAFRPPTHRFYPEGMVFIKRVGGLPGDVVSRRGPAFYINGGFVGLAKAETSGGEPLAPGPVGVIPPGAIFVWTGHPDSYDSRYADIGWIAADRIVGRALRLL
ncbi:MAG: hypothetical protein Kow006_33520 [Gammaproteobacteria bacterium]